VSILAAVALGAMLGTVVYRLAYGVPSDWLLLGEGGTMWIGGAVVAGAFGGTSEGFFTRWLAPIRGAAALMVATWIYYSAVAGTSSAHVQFWLLASAFVGVPMGACGQLIFSRSGWMQMVAASSVPLAIFADYTYFDVVWSETSLTAEVIATMLLVACTPLILAASVAVWRRSENIKSARCLKNKESGCPPKWTAAD